MAERAVAELRAAGMEPLEDFRGIWTPWRSRCRACGTERTPRLGDVRGGHGGCEPCARAGASTAQRTDTQTAIAAMRRAGLDPLDDYPGAGRPWRSLCLECGREVAPRLQKVLEGGGCRYCAGRGFEYSAPGRLYVLSHHQLNAVKVGITGHRSRRLREFAKRGWQIVQLYHFADRRDAAELESSVLRRLRHEMGLTSYLTEDAMEGMRGNTETFDADLLSAHALTRLIDAAQSASVTDS